MINNLPDANHSKPFEHSSKNLTYKQMINKNARVRKGGTRYHKSLGSGNFDIKKSNHKLGLKGKIK